MDLIERAASKLKHSQDEEAEDDGTAFSEASSGTQEVPIINEDIAAAKLQQRRSRFETLDLERLKNNGIITPDDPPSRTAEEFRIVKRQILLKAFGSESAPIRNGNLVLVSSAQPEEGKTFCALNLAMSIASERDLTVLLVDADVARPQIPAHLGLPADRGLVDVILDDSIDLADCLIRTNIANLSVLPAGRSHPLATELLASERMGEIVQELAQRYPDRMIIFDSSPVLASSAPGVLALHVGQVMFVTEADRTRDTQVRESLSLLSGCKNISLLLNKSPFSGGKEKFGSYYGYGYGYGYGPDE